MLHSFRDTLKKTPHDSCLLKYLKLFGYTPSMEADFDGKLNSARADAMALEIYDIQDRNTRDTLISSLQDLARFDDPKSEDVLLNAIDRIPREEDDEYPDDAERTGIQRAIWLYLQDVVKYHQASMKLDMLFKYHFCQRYRYAGSPVLRSDEASREAFRETVQDFYSKKLKFKVFLEVDIWECSPGVHCIMCRIQDLPRTLQVVSRDKIDTIMFSPVRPVAIQYSEETGCADMLISGGEKFVTMLKEAFGNHLLGIETPPDDVQNPLVHLDWLHEEEFFSELAAEDGFTVMRTKSITLVDPTGKMRVTADCFGKNNMESATDFSFDGDPEGMCIFDVLRGWAISSIEIRFIYGEPGKFRGKYKQLSVTVRSNGSTNLTSYPAAIRDRILSYLVDGFIMEVGE